VTNNDDPNAGLPRILVVAPMKSGSTFVGNVLARYFGIADKPVFPPIDFDAEHNLTPWVYLAMRGKSFCFNYHMLPHRSNLTTAANERIALVGLWRNIADMIVSHDDHQARQGENGPGFFVINHAKYRSLAPRERFAFMIDVIAPWYITFYLRWRQANMALHPYEQMLRDQRAFFVELLAPLLTHAPVDELLDASLAAPPTSGDRFNVGQAGRSAKKLDDASKRRLEERILEHPDIAQLEVLLWELPWEVPALEPRLPLDGQVVRTADDERAYFVSRGKAFPVERPSWLESRFGDRRTPRTVDAAELKRYPVGEPLL